MAYNGAGVFNRLYNWVQDKANSIYITASRMDAEMDGIATALSQCIVKDGQTVTPTINNLTLTGNCVAPTQTAGNSSTLLATTAFVTGNTGKLFSIQVFNTPGATTYTPSTGMTSCIVRICGGGGGGGGAAATNGSQVSGSAGGSAGSYAEVLLTAADIGSNQTVTIGSAGTAGASGGSGGAGGTSSIGSLISCPGGAGGPVYGPSTAPFMSQPNAASTSPTISAGTIIASTQGARGNAIICASLSYVGVSLGGVGPFSASCSGVGSGGVGNANQASQSAVTGFAGQAGKCIIYEYR
jgi:hypothetical protein